MYKVKMKGTFARLDMNFAAYLRATEKAVTTQNKQAARVWLREALEHIPTYTGSARGTFRPMGSALRVAVPFKGPKGQPGNAENAKRKKYFESYGAKHRAGFEKTEHLQRHRLITKIAGGVVKGIFEFDQLIEYVSRNDIRPAPQPHFTLPSNPPWNYTQRAALAWRHYIETVAIKRMPKPNQMIKVTYYKAR